MREKLKNRLLDKVENIVLNDALRIPAQMILVTALIFIVSLTMFIVNIITHVRGLMIITGAFSVISFIAGLLMLICHEEKISSGILCLTILSGFTAFLINGGVDGFSPIWFLLIPSSSMFVFGIKKGTQISSVALAIIIVLLWTPCVHWLTYHYTKTFCTRFPIAYISSFIIAYSFEYVRLTTYNKMRRTMKQLDQFVKIDPLTQINNRRYFDTKLNELWDLVTRANGPLAMLMIDVDFFKQYNDHYGHLAGDNVLIEVAGVISDTVSRRNDVVARWGGEEFAVLLPLTDKAGAVRLAAEITASVRSRNIPHEHTKLPDKRITVSIGIASLYPSVTCSPIHLIDLADQSLYDAKQNGRNQAGQVMDHH